VWRVCLPFHSCHAMHSNTRCYETHKMVSKIPTGVKRCLGFQNARNCRFSLSNTWKSGWPAWSADRANTCLACFCWKYWIWEHFLNPQSGCTQHQPVPTISGYNQLIPAQHPSVFLEKKNKPLHEAGGVELPSTTCGWAQTLALLLLLMAVQQLLLGCGLHQKT